MTHKEKIEYIARRIAPILKPGLDPNTYAAALINGLDDHEYSTQLEVHALHTRNNQPFTFWL